MMSLAQRVDVPQPLLVEPLLPSAGAIRSAIPVDFRDITRRAAQVAVVVPVKTEAGPQHDKGAELAFELLAEVSKALPAAMSRCETLQVTLANTREQAKMEIDAANDVAREWQQIASALKLQVEGLEKGIKAMRQRAEAAEQLAIASRDAADKSQHAAAEAECLASLFQEKVIASFGAGSSLHPLLDAFRAAKGLPVPA